MMNVPDMKLYSLFVFILSKYCTTVMSPEETLITSFLSTLIYFNLLVFGTVHLQSSNIRIYYCAISIHAVYKPLDKITLGLNVSSWGKSHTCHTTYKLPVLRVI